MKRKNWYKRFLSSILLSLALLFYSSVKEGNILFNYMNNTFIIGFFLLLIAGSYFVIYSGYFTNFGKLMKKVFSRSDSSFDNSHWSYEEDEEDVLKKAKIKKEIFLYHPAVVGLILMIESIILLFFYYN